MLISRNNRLVLAFAVVALIAPFTGLNARVILPKVISDNMVLQQGKEDIIWGYASPGSKVTVCFADQKKASVAGEDGSWSIKFDPLEASFEPRDLTIKERGSFVVIKDVLVGEVWLASGQSNMEYRMERLAQYAPPERGRDVQVEEIEKGGDPRIRILYVEKNVRTDTLPSAGWKKMSRETLATVSAPAYFFAKTLADSLNVPVGLISSSWGGSMIETWTPQETVEEYMSAYPDTNNVLKKSEYGTKFAHMIEPLAPFAIRGFLWYQGESNLINQPLEYPHYYAKQKNLVESWRKCWGDETLPFYFVQLAPYDYSKRRDLYPVTWNMLPEMWEIQRRLMDLPYCGMAQINDLVDDTSDIHPPYKNIVGYRMALWALKNQYGRNWLETTGPELERYTIADGKLRLIFSHSAGLRTNDGKAPENFQIVALPSTKIISVKAEIDGCAVVLPLDGVTGKAEVRYCWDESSVSNLQNSAGLPAFPFKITIEVD